MKCALKIMATAAISVYPMVTAVGLAAVKECTNFFRTELHVRMVGAKYVC